MNQLGLNHSIIIYSDMITSFAQNTINNETFKKAESIGGKIGKGRYSFEQFSVSQILNSAVDHELVPKHRKLSEAEREELLKTKGWKVENLPKLDENDEISRYYEFNKGDVIEIKETGLNGPYTHWRYVKTV